MAVVYVVGSSTSFRVHQGKWLGAIVRNAANLLGIMLRPRKLKTNTFKSMDSQTSPGFSLRPLHGVGFAKTVEVNSFGRGWTVRIPRSWREQLMEALD